MSLKKVQKPAYDFKFSNTCAQIHVTVYNNSINFNEFI